MCLRQIDPLSRPKNGACPGLFIARYNPQPQSYIERIDAERGPKGKLADPMLSGMAGGAQRNGIAIARFHPHTAIGFRSAHARPLMALLCRRLNREADGQKLRAARAHASY